MRRNIRSKVKFICIVLCQRIPVLLPIPYRIPVREFLRIDAIFERFKKLNEFKQGTGLGLNICRIVAERLHGKVKVDKSYTGGARFLFILPLSED